MLRLLLVAAQASPIATAEAADAALHGVIMQPQLRMALLGAAAALPPSGLVPSPGLRESFSGSATLRAEIAGVQDFGIAAPPPPPGPPGQRR